MNSNERQSEPALFRIEWRIVNGVVYAKPIGQFQVDAWMDSFRNLIHMDRYRLGMPIISDESQNNHRMVDADDMIKVRDFLETELGVHHKHWPCAFTSPDPGVAGVVQLYDFLLNHYPGRNPLNIAIRYFDTISAAEAWVSEFR